MSNPELLHRKYRFLLSGMGYDSIQYIIAQSLLDAIDRITVELMHNWKQDGHHDTQAVIMNECGRNGT